MTLTEWWNELTAQLEALKSIAPVAKNPLLIAMNKMSESGAQLEGCWNPRKLRKIALSIKEAEETLGRKIDGFHGETNFLPKVVSALDILVASIYYEHLNVFERVNSSSNTINEGMYFPIYGKVPGLIDRKPTVTVHAAALKDDIILILNNDERVIELSRLHAKFIPLLSATKESRFDVLLALLLNRRIPATATFCAPLVDERATEAPAPVTGPTLEEKIGERLELQFDIAMRTHSLEKVREKLCQMLSETIKILENIRICKSIHEWAHVRSGFRPSDEIFEKFMRLCEEEEGAHQTLEAYEFYLADEKRKKALPKVNQRSLPKEESSTSVAPLTDIAESSLSPQTEENTAGLRGWLRWGVRTTIAGAQRLPGARFVPYLMPQKPQVILPRVVDISTPPEPSLPEAPSSSVVNMQAMTKRIFEKQIGKLNYQKEGISVEFTIADVEKATDENLTLMVKKAELLSIILKMNDSMSEYTKTHHSWFTRKFHGLFRAFREHDSEFIKTFFVPDKWKFIYEANKLEEVTLHLKNKLYTNAQTTIDEVERELKERLVISKRNVSKIPNESMFFRHKKEQQDLTNKIEAIRKNPRLG